MRLSRLYLQLLQQLIAKTCVGDIPKPHRPRSENTALAKWTRGRRDCGFVRIQTLQFLIPATVPAILDSPKMISELCRWDPVLPFASAEHTQIMTVKE